MDNMCFELINQLFCSLFFFQRKIFDILKLLHQTPLSVKLIMKKVSNLILIVTT